MRSPAAVAEGNAAVVVVEGDEGFDCNAAEAREVVDIGKTKNDAAVRDFVGHRREDIEEGVAAAAEAVAYWNTDAVESRPLWAVQNDLAVAEE